MKEVGPVRFRYIGDIPSCMKYHNEGRKVLGKLKERMKLGGLGGGWYREEVDDYTLIKAESLMGQDIVTIERYVAEEGIEEEEYEPYLWVGARVESADRTDLGLMPRVMINVFEPPVRENEKRTIQFVSSRPYVATGFDSKVYPAGDDLVGCESDGEKQVCPLTRFTLTDDSTAFFAQSELPIDTYPMADAYHTDRGLYLLGHPFAWDPEYQEGAGNETDKIWEEVVILDPLDESKTFTPNSLKGRTVKDGIYGPLQTFGGPQNWRIAGRVIPGRYAIKVCTINQNECEAAPAVVTLEVRLGQNPNQQRFRFEFTIGNAANHIREVFPYGWYDFGHVADASRGYGPNPHAGNWWDRTLLVDVQGGSLQELKPGDEGYYLDDPGYKLHETDMPFVPGEGVGVPQCGCNCMSYPLAQATYDDYIDYRDHPVFGDPAVREAQGWQSAYPIFHYAFLKVTVVCMDQDTPGKPCAAQIIQDCSQFTGSCAPLGYGKVILVKDYQKQDKWELGMEGYIVALAPPGGMHYEIASVEDFSRDYATDFFAQGNLTCPGASGRVDMEQDIAVAGYTVECVGGVETITAYPSWHEGSGAGAF